LFVEFAESGDLIERIKAMEAHFETYLHWYDLADIEERNVLSLKLSNILQDTKITEGFPTFKSELKKQTTQLLACIGLAMHNVIMSKKSEAEKAIFRFQTIDVR